MTSYHIFFTPKPDVADVVVVATAREFFEELKSAGKLGGYRILHITAQAKFPELLRYQAIADFESQAALDAAFAFLRQPGKIHEGAHGRLIEQVAEFKVSFTTDV